MYVLLGPIWPVNCLNLKLKKNGYSMYVGLEFLRDALGVNLDPEAPVMRHPSRLMPENRPRLL
jgi:hypothetical protein